MLLALLTIQHPVVTRPHAPSPAAEAVTQVTYLGEYTIVAYCAEQYPHICGGNPTTASGEPVTPGVTVAADPAVLPLGTRVYIDGIGGRVVQDTGGAIKGRKIDLAVESHQEAVAWGVQHKGVWVCAN
nr:3D domain-containing protein [Acetanaerobacterium sp. MSJ-12]